MQNTIMNSSLAKTPPRNTTSSHQRSQKKNLRTFPFLFFLYRFFFSKLVPKMDSDSDGFVEENELKDHINFMQKRCDFINLFFHETVPDMLITMLSERGRTTKLRKSLMARLSGLTTGNFHLLAILSFCLEKWFTDTQPVKDRNFLPSTAR